MLLGGIAPRGFLVGPQCAIHVDIINPTLAIGLALDAQGGANITRSLPNNPALHGVRVAAQAGVDGGSLAPLGIDISSPACRLELPPLTRGRSAPAIPGPPALAQLRPARSSTNYFVSPGLGRNDLA